MHTCVEHENEAVRVIREAMEKIERGESTVQRALTCVCQELGGDAVYICKRPQTKRKTIVELYKTGGMTPKEIARRTHSRLQYVYYCISHFGR